MSRYINASRRQCIDTLTLCHATVRTCGQTGTAATPMGRLCPNKLSPLRLVSKKLAPLRPYGCYTYRWCGLTLWVAMQVDDVDASPSSVSSSSSPSSSFLLRLLHQPMIHDDGNDDDDDDDDHILG